MSPHWPPILSSCLLLWALSVFVFEYYPLFIYISSYTKYNVMRLLSAIPEVPSSHHSSSVADNSSLFLKLQLCCTDWRKQLEPGVFCVISLCYVADHLRLIYRTLTERLSFRHEHTFSLHLVEHTTHWAVIFRLEKRASYSAHVVKFLLNWSPKL